MSPERVRRVVFHEITPKAIQESFEHPRDIDMRLVDAQQARRILDRLVGFNLSPLLWKKVRGRLSAGRVQSPALRMIVERERAIRDFVPVEYWSIRADLAQQSTRGTLPRPSVEARLHRIEGEEPLLPDEETTQRHLARLGGQRYVVTDVRKSERRRNPSAPFTTSTLQQEASRRLGFGTQRTMAVAQSLYEGVPINDGETVGLISYMRTDSVNVSADASQEARDLISPELWQRLRAGADSDLQDARQKSAGGARGDPPHQRGAHPRANETLPRRAAGQPVRAYLEPLCRQPDGIGADGPDHGGHRAGRGGDCRGRYEERRGGKHRAAQHEPSYLFRASGSVVRFLGFLALYEESRDEDDPEEESGLLPDLAAGEVLDGVALRPHQHFTQPPPRFSDATLVRALEENGIGRPSTYAPTVQTLSTRGYVERDNKRLVPTELGEIVTDLLVEHFPDVLDVGFTAQMEDELDEVAEGEREWHSVLDDFYDPFNTRLERAKENMEKVQLEDEKAGVSCEKCGRDMVVKWGRYGKFIACPGFPECRNTLPYLELIGVPCPQCATGEIAEKRTKGGRVFYGCSNYPECEFSSWKKPVAIPCPTCQGLLVEANRTQYQCLSCDERFMKDAFPQGDEERHPQPA